MKTTNNGYMFKRSSAGKKVADDEPGIYYLQIQTNGKRTLMSLKTDNKKVAEQKRKDYLEDPKRAKSKERMFFHFAEARQLTEAKVPIDIAWSKYEKCPSRPQSADGTLGNHKRNWNHFKDWILSKHPETVNLNQITKHEAEEYTIFLWKTNITADTFRYKFITLKLVYKNLLNTPQTPFDKIKKTKVEGIARLGFSLEQIEKIHKILNDPTLTIAHKDEWHLACYISQFTGARLVDTILMQCSSINLDKNNISFKPIKTIRANVNVSMPIATQLREKLQQVDLTGKYVLPKLATQYLKEDTRLKLDFALVLDKAEIKDKQERDRGETRRLYGFHSFRHHFADFQVNKETPVAILASLMGDNIRTVERYYATINEESKIKAIQRFDNTSAISDTERIQSTVEMLETLDIPLDAKVKLLKILQG